MGSSAGTIRIDLKPNCGQLQTTGHLCRDVNYWMEWLGKDEPVAHYRVDVEKHWNIVDGEMPPPHIWDKSCPFISYNATARNLTRRAIRKGYTCRELSWPDYNSLLDQVHAVNISLPCRQGREMSASYLTMPTAQTAPAVECPRHFSRFHGVFKDNILVGYINASCCGNMAAASMILGHADHLREGIMPLLWDWFVRWAASCGFINIVYSRWNDGLDGLRGWKHSVGMNPERLGVL